MSGSAELNGSTTTSRDYILSRRPRAPGIEPVGARDTGRLVPEQAEAKRDAHGEDRGLVPSATTPESAQTWAKERRPQRVTIQFETGGAGGGRGAEGGVRASPVSGPPDGAGAST